MRFCTGKRIQFDSESQSVLFRRNMRCKFFSVVFGFSLLPVTVVVVVMVLSGEETTEKSGLRSNDLTICSPVREIHPTFRQIKFDETISYVLCFEYIGRYNASFQLIYRQGVMLSGELEFSGPVKANCKIVDSSIGKANVVKDLEASIACLMKLKRFAGRRIGQILCSPQYDRDNSCSLLFKTKHNYANHHTPDANSEPQVGIKEISSDNIQEGMRILKHYNLTTSALVGKMSVDTGHLNLTNQAKYNIPTITSCSNSVCQSSSVEKVKPEVSSTSLAAPGGTNVFEAHSKQTGSTDNIMNISIDDKHTQSTLPMVKSDIIKNGTLSTILTREAGDGPTENDLSGEEMQKHSSNSISSTNSTSNHQEAQASNMPHSKSTDDTRNYTKDASAGAWFQVAWTLAVVVGSLSLLVIALKVSWRRQEPYYSLEDSTELIEY